MIGKILPLVLKALVSGLFGFVGDQIKAFKRDRALQKIGSLKLKDKIHAKQTKVLKKIQKKRSRLRTDDKYARRMRNKYTRHD